MLNVNYPYPTSDDYLCCANANFDSNFGGKPQYNCIAQCILAQYHNEFVSTIVVFGREASICHGKTSPG